MILVLILVFLIGVIFFGVGIYGVFLQINLVMIMMGVELILVGVLVNFVVFWCFLYLEVYVGQMFVLVVMMVMVVEMVVGFGVVIVCFWVKGLVEMEEVGDLQG